MKAIVLLFLCAFTSGFSQGFVVSKTGGLVSKKDGKVDYIIVESPGIPADTLYASAKKYIETKSADTKISLTGDNAGKSLIYDTTDASITTLTKNGQDVSYTATYTTSLEFKDGKARITYGNISIYAQQGGASRESYPLTSVYTAAGKVADKKVKNLIENYFTANAQALAIAFKSDGKGPGDSW
ncbi:DUF4468 domain-containing protein [Flavobacterium sp. Sd200]|uniref:DUF4468 domain-containing protein n=1 Tax=Flavobacterium sp. Sd200 TaxID=2692211 RepID=UPI00136EF248|nr:DUF4468 domain-containing protein [Flavobacterium sp. Sd200]MXN91235.1 DUF4468 domain-containing protein [Flavobacterium sp. Sd200]